MAHQRMQNSAAERAHWLTELAEALDAAQRLATQLRADPIACRTVAALEARLTLAIAEVDMLRRGGAWRSGGEVGPKWLNFPSNRTHLD